MRGSYIKAKFALLDAMRGIRSKSKEVNKTRMTSTTKYGKVFHTDMEKEDKEYKKNASWRF